MSKLVFSVLADLPLLNLMLSPKSQHRSVLIESSCDTNHNRCQKDINFDTNRPLKYSFPNLNSSNNHKCIHQLRTFGLWD